MPDNDSLRSTPYWNDGAWEPSDAGEAFNGGTITGPLTVDSSSGSLVTLAVRAASNQTDNIAELSTDDVMAGVFVDATGSVYTTAADGSRVVFTVQKTVAGAGGHLFEAKDASNNVVFRIASDGTVHIKNGASVVADL